MKICQEKHKQLPLQGLAEAARNVTIHQVGQGWSAGPLEVEALVGKLPMIFWVILKACHAGVAGLYSRIQVLVFSDIDIYVRG